MNVVVSGTSAGIGLAIAQKFLSEGHAVFGVDKHSAVIEHECYEHATMDIRDSHLREVAEKWPDADVIIACAGTLDEMDAIDVNLVGTIAFVGRFVDSPSLSSVLFVASASARNGAEFPLYVASKAGIVGYMKNLALQLAPRGVTCNSVSPGGVLTPSNNRILKDEKLYREVLDETLLGKWAEPAEIADFVYFLTVNNRSMTGEDILVDNGEMLKSNFVW